MSYYNENIPEGHFFIAVAIGAGAALAIVGGITLLGWIGDLFSKLF